MSERQLEPLSRAFELRHFRHEHVADGPTDFKGETAVFDTEERLAYLRDYARFASGFFGDPDLDTPVITDEEVGELTNRLKPQPLPGVRNRIRLEKWNTLGCRPGQPDEDRLKLKAWDQNRSVEVGDGRLRFAEDGEITYTFEPQSWRMRFEWSQQGPVSEITFQNGDSPVASARLPQDESGAWTVFVAELDLAEQRWNLYAGEKPVIEWQPLDGEPEAVDSLRIRAGSGAQLGSLWGVGFLPTDNVRKPYDITTVLDDTFTVRPDPDGWQKPGYDDTGWQETGDPFVHGGERHAGEDLYLRTRVQVHDSYEKAWLNIETLDPGGEVYVNGYLVSVSRDRHPQKLDVTPFLEPAAENVLAVRVYPIDPDLAGNTFPHSGNDPHIGWFAGRMHLDLTSHAHVDDLFVYTTSVTAGGQAQPQVVTGEEFNADTAGRVDAPPAEHAKVTVRATVANRASEDRWRGFLRIRFFPWLPVESDRPVAETEVPVDCCEWRDQELETRVEIPEPRLWTYRSPALYKVSATLTDAQHQPVDDEVVTTGLRTISQTGGNLRINNQPEMLNGAQIFGLRAPLEKLAAWQRRPPAEWLVREVAQIRRMNGNAMRIHVHAWAHLPPARSINDVRLAEIGDQLGIMFYWATTAWIRSGTPWGVDLEGLPEYVRQVRNHPSIVLWELSNHPTCNQLYERGPEGWDAFYRAVHDTIYPLDPSRLIAPMAIVGEGSEDTPALDRPGMVRGAMDAPTGMGADWTRLRDFLAHKQKSFAELKNRAYFNFEHQESIGQPNWSLCRGKPWYQVMSYEWHADEGSIGRKLTAEEWRESQAWQAFSAYEAIRLMRRIGYDGFSWCCLHGGPNTVTYKKPLIDYLGYPKLAWYTNRMAFQDVVAGSDDADVVYGPDDWIYPVIQNLGPARVVDVEVTVKTPEGEVMDRRRYEKVKLPEGRTVINLPAFRPENQLTGNHALEYTVHEAGQLSRF